jgi:hypothetical protein
VGWKPLVWFIKENRRCETYVSDVVPTTTPDKQLHDWGQGEVEADYLIRQLTAAGEVVLDPMCGGATTVCAAVRAGRRAVGVEIEPERANVARGRAKDAVAGSAKQTDGVLS